MSDSSPGDETALKTTAADEQQQEGEGSSGPAGETPIVAVAPPPPPPSSSPLVASTSRSRSMTPTQQIIHKGLDVVEQQQQLLLLQQHDAPEMPRTPRDDNSRYQFMSEPSMSEDDPDRIIAPHRLPPNAFRRQHHGNHGSVPNSPGNTSLSSWDTTNSPGRVVQLHFASSSGSIGPPSIPPPVTIEHRNGERRVRVQQNLLPRKSFSSSQISEDGSLGPPSLPRISTDLDSDDHKLVTSPEDEKNGVTNHARKNTKEQAENAPLENSAISINMALSDSEDDDKVDHVAAAASSRTISTGSGIDDEGLLDWETRQDHVADDEKFKTTRAPQNVQQQQQQPSITPGRRTARQHRRTRSGDAAAATLATGGNDWKGMTKDQIPIPEAIDDETDDSSAPEPSSSKNKKTKNGDRQTSVGNFEQHLQMLFAQDNSGRNPLEQHTEQHVMQQKIAWYVPENNQSRQFTIPYSERQRSRQNLEQKSFDELPSPYSPPQSPGIARRQTSLPFVWSTSPSLNGKQTVEQANLQKQQSEPNMYQRASQDQMARQGYGSNREIHLLQQNQNQPSMHQELERQMFQQNLRRHFMQFNGERHTLDQHSQPHLSYHSMEGYPDHGDSAYVSPFDRMTPPTQPSYLGQMMAASPRQRQIPGSPRVGGNLGDSQVQLSPSVEGHPQSHGIGGSSPFAFTRYSTSPNPYSEPGSINVSATSLPPFSPGSSMLRDRAASFPIVEDVDEDKEESEYSAELQDEQSQKLDSGFSQSQRGVLPPTYIPDNDSPFANLGKKSADKARRSSFMPIISSQEDHANYPTYICPRCKTRQREFFTTSDAPRALSEPSNYLAFYFGVYVIASLFIFGLEEGWKPLDCVYFAVITLTTAGLGDYVPTTDANKIICSIFIYFGVACIGLLLGSYIAGMLDDRAYRDAKKKQMDSCPNCARIMSMKEAAERIPPSRNPGSPRSLGDRTNPIFHLSLRNINVSEDHIAVYVPRHHENRSENEGSPRQNGSVLGEHHSIDLTAVNSMPSIDEQSRLDGPPPSPGIPPPPPAVSEHTSTVAQGGNHNVLGSPMTRQILGRQKHTRHASIDVANMGWNPGTRKFSADLPSVQTTPPTISEGFPLNPPLSAPNAASQVPFVGDGPATHSLRGSAFAFDEDDSILEDEDDFSDESSSTASTADEFMDERVSRLKAAKYVFLTLRQALVNSMVIIAVGCIGFVLTEEFSIVDSWYFTTVLLTTVGYGDIVPITNGGKLFATVYILVAGTVLINNMSLISMIPLELRRRRIERAVLTQFGDQLDDAALRELATGPLIQRLSLSANRADGLDECTREMFSLAMLVRLGKVTEEDIRETFAAFRRLDVNDEGLLNSKSIIAGMIQKHRSQNSQMGRRRQSSGALSSLSRTSNTRGNPMPYWQMPQLPLTTTTSAGYDDTTLGFMPEQPSQNMTDQFMEEPGQYGTNLPTETTSLL